MSLWQIHLNISLEHQVHRIETKQAPKPSQPEVVLSDGEWLKIHFVFGSISLSKFFG